MRHVKGIKRLRRCALLRVIRDWGRVESPNSLLAPRNLDHLSRAVTSSLAHRVPPCHVCPSLLVALTAFLPLLQSAILRPPPGEQPDADRGVWGDCAAAAAGGRQWGPSLRQRAGWRHLQLFLLPLLPGAGLPARHDDAYQLVQVCCGSLVGWKTRAAPGGLTVCFLRPLLGLWSLLSLGNLGGRACLRPPQSPPMFCLSFPSGPSLAQLLTLLLRDPKGQTGGGACLQQGDHVCKSGLGCVGVRCGVHGGAGLGYSDQNCSHRIKSWSREAQSWGAGTMESRIWSGLLGSSSVASYTGTRSFG